MTAAGPKSPSSVTSTQVSVFSETVPWSDPGNAVSSNDSYATVTLGPSDLSYALRCTGFGFTSGDVPGGATIDGILVEIEVSQDGDALNVLSPLVYGGSQLGGGGVGLGQTAGNTGFAPDGTDTYWPLGDSTDTGSASLTQAMVVDSSFGIDIYFSVGFTGAGSNVSVDHVRLTIYYTAGVGGGTTYNDTYSATVASGFTVASAQTMPNTLAESLASANTFASAMTMPNAYASSVAANDNLSANLVIASTLAETLAAAFTLANSQVMPNTLSQSVAASDAFAAGLIIGSAISETLAGSDGFAAAMTFAPALSESVAAAFAVATAQTMPNALSESLASDATLATAATYSPTLAEAVASLDSMAASQVMPASVVETLVSAGLFQASAIYPNAMSEAIGAADGFASGLSFMATISEGMVCGFTMAIEVDKSVQYSAERGYLQVRTGGSSSRRGVAAPTRQGSIARRAN